MIDLFRILVAPLLWLSAFTALYALHGLACAAGWSAIESFGLSLQLIVLLAAWLIATLAQIGVLVALGGARYGAPPGFVRRVSLTTGWAALIATIWTLQPVVTTTSCG